MDATKDRQGSDFIAITSGAFPRLPVLESFPLQLLVLWQYLVLMIAV